MTVQEQDSPVFNNLDDLLKQLSPEQLKYVRERLGTNTNAEAAKRAGVNADTMNHWPEWVRTEIPRLLAMDGVHLAAEMRRRAIPDAMAVKVDGLKSMDEKVRQNVATELIEWEMGKAVQRTQMDTKGDITLRVVYQDGTDDQSTQAA